MRFNKKEPAGELFFFSDSVKNKANLPMEFEFNSSDCLGSKIGSSKFNWVDGLPSHFKMDQNTLESLTDSSLVSVLVFVPGLVFMISHCFMSKDYKETGVGISFFVQNIIAIASVAKLFTYQTASDWFFMFAELLLWYFVRKVEINEIYKKKCNALCIILGL